MINIYKNLVVFAFFLISTITYGQTSTITLTYNSGSYDNENSFQLYNLTSSTELECYEEATSGAFTMTYTINDTDILELRSWESYGDGWSGASIELTNTTTGVDLFPSQAPSTSGNGAVICGTDDSSGDVIFNGVASPPAPSNDDCGNATGIIIDAAPIAGTTVATTTPDDPTGCASDYGVWYTVNGTGTDLTVTSNATFDHEIDIFTSNAGCGGVYTTISCVDNSTGTETYTFLSTSGVTYYIYIAHYSTTSTITGTFDIEVTGPPAPIDYCGADQFLDSGGAAGSYDDDENLSWTICPDNPTDKVTITFTEFEVEGRAAGTCWDELRIYDGPDNSATELSPANGYCFQSITDGTSYPGGGLGVPITSTDASGCLHFNFTSDGSGQYAGWVADVTCAPYVDPATIVTLAPAGTSMMTADDATIGANNYTYYEDPANAGNYLFAVNWDASGNGHNDASDVTITVDNAPADGTADDGGDNATWTMKRFWNVDMGAGVLVDPVDVKFFYDGAEKTATENSAISDGRPVEPSAWFKTATGPWNNMPGAGNPAIDVIELTDANAGAGTMENGVVYAEFNSVASFSGGSFASGVGPAASSLPLELLEWKGESMKKANKLMWKTTNEQNTANFFVEKLHNQNDWRPIGELAAAGNSSSILDYSILDESPSSIELYRLKSMDIDGQYTYSQVIEIRRTLTDNVIEAYPNPFNEQIQVQLNLTTGQQGNISIFDVNGKLISSLQRSLEEGSNSILINLENESSGIYLISVQLNDSILQKRIIKQ